MTKTQETHLRRAINIASNSTCRQKHGVVIAKGRKVLAVAVNTHRNHPKTISNCVNQASYHAEWNALKILQEMDLSRCTLYSARVNAKGEAVLAKPCAHCAYLIEFFGIKNVVWTE